MRMKAHCRCFLQNPAFQIALQWVACPSNINNNLPEGFCRRKWSFSQVINVSVHVGWFFVHNNSRSWLHSICKFLLIVCTFKIHRGGKKFPYVLQQAIVIIVSPFPLLASLQSLFPPYHLKPWFIHVVYMAGLILNHFQLWQPWATEIFLYTFSVHSLSTCCRKAFSLCDT
jgi:hypothetical protein